MWVRLDRFASVYLTPALLDARLAKPLQPGISILMYHSVSDRQERTAAPYYRLATSPERFREHIQFLRDREFEVISLSQVASRLMAGLSVDERSVVVTFDDGFDDFRKCAWPVLAASGYTATMFLATALIGKKSRSFKGRPCLTWTDVRNLHREGVSFGSHTVTHPVLHRMTWGDIRQELCDSKRRIEDEIQASIKTFAYPFAFPQEDQSFVARFRVELAEAGYSTAVTTMIGRAQANADLRCLRRLPVNDDDDHRLFSAKLSGKYDWLGRVQWASRAFKSRLRRAS
jgi:peptidoglycan/xylan/chitin deacetylase (PgdA/CDA1 family)